VTRTDTPAAEPIDDAEVVPEPTEATIPTTTVEVEGLGTIGEDQLPTLTKDLLKDVLRKGLNAVPPRSATRDELETLARNGLRLRAMVEADTPVVAVDEPEQNEDEVAEAALVAYEAAQERPLVAPPSVFDQIVAISQVMSKSNLVPDALRGPGKLPDLQVVLLRAWDLGISQSAALENLYVVHGKIGMEGKLMAALVRRAGHSLVVVESDRFHAIWRGVRADNGDAMEAEFDLIDAKNAGLIQDYDENTYEVTPIRDKPMYKSYTKAMLKWRALAILCRDLFSDCLAGVSYLPEELGYIDTEAADTLPPGASQAGGTGRPSTDEQTHTLNSERSALAARITQLPRDLRVDLGAEWTKRNLPKVDDLRPAAIRTARNLITAAEQKLRERTEAETGPVDDAELGDDDAPDGARLPETDDSDDLTEFCEGCGDPIGDDEHPVYDDQEKPWHVACSPDFTDNDGSAEDTDDSAESDG